MSRHKAVHSETCCSLIQACAALAQALLWQGVVAVDQNGVLVAARPHRRGPIHELELCATADFDAPGCRVLAGPGHSPLPA